jgi:hypothetical protein
MSNKLAVRDEFVIDFGLDVITKHGLGLGALFEQTV